MNCVVSFVFYITWLVFGPVVSVLLFSRSVPLTYTVLNHLQFPFPISHLKVPFYSWNHVVCQPAVLALLWPFHCHRITDLIAHNEKSKVRKGRRLILLCWNIIPCEWGISISVDKDEVGCIVLKPDLSPLSLHPWPLSCVVCLSAFEPTEAVHYCCTTQSLYICCTYLRTDSPIFFRAAVAIACFNMREMQYTY